MRRTPPVPALLPAADIERQRLGQVAWLLQPGKIEAAVGREAMVQENADIHRRG